MPPLPPTRRRQNLRRSRVWIRSLAAAGLLSLATLPAPAAARPASSRPHTAKLQRHAELTAWEQAERARDTLEAIPGGSRTHADYSRAMDAFRAIYHANPADEQAPEAITAVAELLAEQGRTFHDAKSFQAAVGQYEFLRTQYPGSSLRIPALLAEAQIQQNDLHDTAAARERYNTLLKHYPHNGETDEARAGLAALDAARPAPQLAAQLPLQTATPPVISASRGTASAPTSHQAGTLPPMPPTSGVPTPQAGQGSRAEQPAGAGAVRLAAANATVKHNGPLAQVTGIRHWSTPTYTRVAIDLGDNVTFEAARVPHPDRIYFDLHGARLAQELVGKSFAVTDDGFLKKIRAAQFSNDMTRVVLDVNDVTEYSAFLLPNPYRLIIDIHGGSAAAPVVSVDATPRRADAAPTVPNTTAVKQPSSADIAAVSELPGKVEATTRPTSQPISAVVPGAREQIAAADRMSTRDSNARMASARAAVVAAAAPAVPMIPTDDEPAAAVPAKRSRRVKPPASNVAEVDPGVIDGDAKPARAAIPTADGQTSMVRALGLKIGRIVIDPGHGGHDSGTLGADGIEEKDVVLDVALRLGKLLHERLGAEIIYTRSDDTFIPLETRTAIANKAQADLFLSIHANSSSDASARGVETYYLNFTSQPDALEVAARENAVSGQSIHQLSDLVKKIALKDKIAESREFASDVEQSLYGGLQAGNAGLKNRGVKKAPFVVLIGANMPSILAEISFVTNPKDATQLRQPDYRQRVAESLYKGVARYAGGLSGARTTTERASSDQDSLTAEGRQRGTHALR